MERTSGDGEITAATIVFISIANFLFPLNISALTIPNLARINTIRGNSNTSPKAKIKIIKKDRASPIVGKAFTYSDEYSERRNLNAGGAAKK